MYKTMIAPIVAVGCLILAAFTGVKVEESVQEQIVSGVAVLISAGVTIWGIYKNHKK